jgi:hypothetical protein
MFCLNICPDFAAPPCRQPLRWDPVQFLFSKNANALTVSPCQWASWIGYLLNGLHPGLPRPARALLLPLLLAVEDAVLLAGELALKRVHLGLERRGRLCTKRESKK